jgi:hypothetical protein
VSCARRRRLTSAPLGRVVALEPGFARQGRSSFAAGNARHTSHRHRQAQSQSADRSGPVPPPAPPIKHRQTAVADLSRVFWHRLARRSRPARCLGVAHSARHSSRPVQSCSPLCDRSPGWLCFCRRQHNPGPLAAVDILSSLSQALKLATLLRVNLIKVASRGCNLCIFERDSTSATVAQTHVKLTCGRLGIGISGCGSPCRRHAVRIRRSLTLFIFLVIGGDR